ncbi:MAG TPA: EpsI family protein [Propionibacteriaceae bacterium]|nr:EpsI family protein [Propionibacteriaceae bacterium]
MINRRALIAGVACVAAALSARQLKPHHYVSLLKSAKLDNLIPRAFGSWTSEDVGDPLALNGPGTLSSKLYNQLVTRAYADGRGNQILMLLAHGERQSDELQLHRPEICYPAFGYALLRNEPTQIRLGEGVTLPARRLVAKSPNHEESVLYWSRLGEYFPVDGGEQRAARFANARAGIIPDGILCRFSTPDESARAWAGLEQFVHDLIAATTPTGQRVLVGSDRTLKLDKSRTSKV